MDIDLINVNDTNFNNILIDENGVSYKIVSIDESNINRLVNQFPNGFILSKFGGVYRFYNNMDNYRKLIPLFTQNRNETFTQFIQSIVEN